MAFYHLLCPLAVLEDDELRRSLPEGSAFIQNPVFLLASRMHDICRWQITAWV